MATHGKKRQKRQTYRKRDPKQVITPEATDAADDADPFQTPELVPRRNAAAVDPLASRRGAVSIDLNLDLDIPFKVLSESPDLASPDCQPTATPDDENIPRSASLLSFYKSVTIDTDSDWESGDEEKEHRRHPKKARQHPAPPTHKVNKPSVDYFRIKSVTVFGDALFGDKVRKEMKEDKNKADDAWKEKRKLIEDELIATERNYAHDLSVLCDEILGEIFVKKLLDDKYKAQVTSNLPMIRNFHNEYFLPELIAGDVVKVFNNSADLLKMYVTFVKQYDDILDIFAVHGNKSKNKKLYKFLKQKRKEKKPLTNLLISPIQRIPRYLLLLQDIKKRTPPDYDDYEDIEIALKKVKNITNHINERQKEIENMSQCLQIQNKLRGFKGNLVEPHRKYINQFTFHFDKGKKLKLNQFCIFSDTVIITDFKWNVIQNINMRSMKIKKANHNLHGKGFEIKNIGIYFDTQETMNDDVDELCQIVEKEKEILLEQDMDQLDAEKNTISKQLDLIKEEDRKQKHGLLVKLKKGSQNLEEKNQFKRTKTLPKSKTNLWGRNVKMDQNNKMMCVEWNFVDEYDDHHCVILEHQQIKGNPNKKSKRIIKIDKEEAYNDKSKKMEFVLDLRNIKNKRLSNNEVILQMNINYDKKKSKYSYPLLINNKTYPKSFQEWRIENA